MVWTHLVAISFAVGDRFPRHLSSFAPRNNAYTPNFALQNCVISRGDIRLTLYLILRSQSFLGPLALIALNKHDSVVKAIESSLPEFDARGDDVVTAPVLRQRYLLALEFRHQFTLHLLQLFPRFDFRRLSGNHRTDLAAARARVKVFLRGRPIGLSDSAFHPYLPA